MRRALYVVLFLCIGLIYFMITQCETNNIIEDTLEMYPSLDEKESYKGVIVSIYDPLLLRRSPHAISITFAGGSKYTIATKGFSINSSNVALRDVSKIGAEVTKKDSSDLIEVRYKGDSYIFKIKP